MCEIVLFVICPQKKYINCIPLLKKRMFNVGVNSYQDLKSLYKCDIIT